MGRYTLDYRPEIDGLRAWAVVLVILFHARISGFSGGFIGVDVFFVISGYLITRLIADEAERGEFTILGFYERRVRRIIPAMTVMVAASLAFGVIVMLPGSLERLSKSGISTMLFSSNIYFWRVNSNYFAAPAELNPLLHTWSLAVEEQFYLVFPPLFIVLFRASPRLLLGACVVVAAVSLTAAEFGNHMAPTATFFLSPTRAWEFLAGSMLALNIVPPVRGRRLGVALTLAGLALIVASGFLLRPDAGFPGLLAIPPVLGTALIIHAAPAARGTAATLLFTWRPILFTGLISYSLYLWHWPVLVFGEHFVLQRPLTTTDTAVLLALGAALAVLSFYLVEQPFRRGVRWRRRAPLFGAGVGMTAAIVAVGGAVAASDGLAFRYPGISTMSLQRQIKSEKSLRASSRDDCFVKRIGNRRVYGCVLTQGERNVMLWGDSFAGHYAPAIAGLGELPGGRGAILFNAPQCPPVLDYDPVNLPFCATTNRRALEAAAAHGVDTIILSANWHAHLIRNRFDLEDIADTVRELKARGLRVVVIGQSPKFHFTQPEEYVFGKFLRDGPTETVSARNLVPPDFNDTLRATVTKAGADLFFDPTTSICEGQTCRYYQDSNYLVIDTGHLSVAGSRPVVEALFEALRMLPEN